VQVATPIPQTARWSLTICPNLAELLAIVALCKFVLNPVSSALIAIWQRAVSLKTSYDFVVRGKVIRYKGRFMVWVPSVCDQRIVVISLTLVMSEPRSISPSEMSCARVFNGRCRITALMGFWNLG
jgi:hypothetical protein